MQFIKFVSTLIFGFFVVIRKGILTIVIWLSGIVIFWGVIELSKIYLIPLIIQLIIVSGLYYKFHRKDKNYIKRFIFIELIIVSSIFLFLFEKTNVDEEVSKLPLINSSKIDKDKEGKLVQLDGYAKTKDYIRYDDFNIYINAINLDIAVKYYHEKKIAGNYKKAWQDSKKIKKNHKDNMVNVKSHKISVKNVNIGPYKLPEFLISKINKPHPLKINLSDNAKIELIKKSKFKNILTGKKEKDIMLANKLIHVKDNIIYFGENSNNPKIGDVYITFNYTKAVTEVSLVSILKGNSFIKSKESYIKLKKHKVFSKENLSFHIIFIRIIFFSVFCSLFLHLFAITHFHFQLLRPILGDFVYYRRPEIVGIVVGVLWGLLVLSTSWLIYNPISGIVFLLIFIGLIFLIRYYNFFLY